MCEHRVGHTHTRTQHVRVHERTQTGSGKTFTIYGTDDEPGLTRHGIHELFRVRSHAGARGLQCCSCKAPVGVHRPGSCAAARSRCCCPLLLTRPCVPQITDRDSGKFTFSITLYMLELYQVGARRGAGKHVRVRADACACTQLRPVPHTTSPPAPYAGHADGPAAAPPATQPEGPGGGAKAGDQEGCKGHGGGAGGDRL